MTTYYRTLHNHNDETGQKFGRLFIVSVDWSQKPSIALCRCDCGNYIRVAKADVVSGHTQSCGCLQPERASETNLRDFSGLTSTAGVIIAERSRQNDHGVWLWNCICPLCGEVFEAIPAKVLSNHITSCGCKIQSSRERIISKILNDMHITYMTQYRFDECKDKYTLPFDFAIMKEDKPVSLIEYDGQQHFKPVPFWGGEAGLAMIQKHDRIKNEYCASHNIPLLRLNYTENEQNFIEKITNIIYA